MSARWSGCFGGREKWW